MNSKNSSKTIPYQGFDLFYKGDLSLLERPKVAIVGSRKANQYAKLLTATLAAKLSQKFTIVSGGAIGIDAIAHKNAFPNTIFVSPCGLDRLYPSTNRELLTSIYEKGLALSEYKEGSEPRKHHFIERNRIVVGISDIVILAQAEKKSGTMHSYRWAKEAGKKIYALSHRIGESEGSNLLISQKEIEGIYDVEFFLESVGITEENDPFLEFCTSHPTFEEAYLKWGDIVYEYELEGNIRIENGIILPSL